MKDLRLTDKVERVIMEVGNLSIKNTLLFTNRNKEDYKLNPVTNRKWTSNKYKQDNDLNTMTFRSSDYLVFDYNDWDTKTKNQIFVSYPNMYFVKVFFNNCMEFLSQDGIFGKDDVNADFKNVLLQSEPLASGKKLGAFPSKTTRGEYLVDSITLIIGNNDCMVDIDISTFAAIADIIEGFDLYTASNQLYQMALTVAYAGNSGSTSSSSTGGFNTSNTPRRQPPAGGLNGNRGGSTVRNRPSSNLKLNGNKSNNTVINNVTNKPVDTDISIIPDSEVPFTGGDINPTLNTPNDIFSMDNIMDAGANTDLDSINLDMDDELDF